MVEIEDLFENGVPFLLGRAVDDIGVLEAQQLHVGRNLDDAQTINVAELGRLGNRRAGHTGQLLVHAEIVLEGDLSQGLVLGLDFDPLLGLQGLV